MLSFLLLLLADAHAQTNLALNKFARQSKTIPANDEFKIIPRPQGKPWMLAGEAALAVDGNKDPYFKEGSVSLSGGGHNWWEVDLGAIASINQVKIYNRMDCCMEKLNNPTITVYTYDRVEVAKIEVSEDSPEVIEVEMGNVVGTYVRITNPFKVALSMAEVEVFGDVVGPIDNLAFGKYAEHSSTFAGSVATRATDGNIDGRDDNHSIACTFTYPYSYWRVNLGVIAAIDRVIIFNRVDEGHERNLNEIMVEVLDNKLTEVAQVTLNLNSPEFTIVNLNGAEGTWIQLFNGNGRPVEIAEVEVYGTVLSENIGVVEPLPNLASRKPSYMSGTMYNAYAHLANDGNMFGEFKAGSVAHSDPIRRPWWSVELEAITSIEKVVLFNRIDCCMENINRLIVFCIHDDKGITGSVFLNENSPELAVANFDNVEAMSIFIVAPLNTIINLAEVKVYGQVISEDVHLGLNKPATQSSTFHGGEASRAVDGSVNGRFSQDTVTHTGPGKPGNYPWWEVDLQETATIRTIVIYNRVDECCINNINNAIVYILDANRNQVAKRQLNEDGPAKITLNFVGVIGSFVRVELTETLPLSLAEVKIYGDVVDTNA